jgi:hypothetical protein
MVEVDEHGGYIIPDHLQAACEEAMTKPVVYGSPHWPGWVELQNGILQVKKMNHPLRSRADIVKALRNLADSIERCIELGTPMEYSLHAIPITRHLYDPQVAGGLVPKDIMVDGIVWIATSLGAEQCRPSILGKLQLLADHAAKEVETHVGKPFNDAG